jgi:hypothetical protein
MDGILLPQAFEAFVGVIEERVGVGIEVDHFERSLLRCG